MIYVYKNVPHKPPKSDTYGEIFVLQCNYMKNLLQKNAQFNYHLVMMPSSCLIKPT